jgi:serine/threonine protein kinase
VIPEAQEWLRARLEGLEPEDIFGGVSFAVYSVYSGPRLLAPSAFRHVWHNIDTHHRIGGVVPSEEHLLLRSAKVVLVLADLSNRAHMQDVQHLGNFLQKRNENQACPHVILVQHSAKPCNRINFDASTTIELFTNALQMGMDIVLDEATGFKLAWSLQNRFLRQRITTKILQESVHENCNMLQNLDDITWNMHETVWSYLRVRVDTHVPPLDPNINPGRPRTIDGFRIGDVLGRGAVSTVYKLMHNGNASGRVLKSFPKSHIKDIHDVKTLGRHIKVMELLSLERYTHPNVTQLLGVHHSVTHIFFQLEDSGARDLKKRLRHRDNRHSPLSSLSSRKVQSIFSQVSAAISHLHTGPVIAHLDIKPANLIVSEGAEDIHISIADFDTAVVQPCLSFCGVFGTVPFVAPEVFRQDTYNPFAADVWSMAVSFLEVVCCLRVVEKALHLQRLPNHAPYGAIKSHEKNMTGSIRQYFSGTDAVNKLLQYYLHPTLQDMLGSLESVLPDMLQVASSSRATSSQVAQAFFHTEE